MRVDADRIASGVRWIVVALLAVALVPIARALLDEAAVRRASALAVAASDGAPPIDPPSARTPRADAVAALTLAQDASHWSIGAPLRIARARALIDGVLRARPAWGQAWAVKAYVELIAAGRDTPEVRTAFSRSLIYAPYLNEIAAWRVQYGLAAWPLLDPGTQARVIDEAVWHSQLSPARLRQVEALVRGGPLQARFERRRAETAATFAKRRAG